MRLTTLAAAAAVAALAATAAGATTIDFTTFTDGTSISSIGPVSFSLYGGNASGQPLVSDYWGAQWGESVPIELNNTPTGQYPTSEGIQITFAKGANNVSYTYENYSYDGAFETAFSGTTQTDLQYTGGCAFSFCTITVAGSDITTLNLDNGAGGGDWEFGVGEITYTSAVPEPASWALMLIGVAALGGALRAGRRSALTA